jgi:hypothetical protein
MEQSPFIEGLERLWVANEATKKARSALTSAEDETRTALGDVLAIIARGIEVESMEMLNGFKAAGKLLADAMLNDQGESSWDNEVDDLRMMGEMAIHGIMEWQAAA